MTQISIHAIRVIALFGFFVTCNATFGADKYEERLSKVLFEYRALPNTQDVKRLVELDRELNELEKEINEKHKEGASKKYWRKEFEEIGLYIGHYSEALEYSGKLLVEAHKRNPNSPYRKYTLFTTILGEGTSHGLGAMPNIDQAELYLKEFPDGPYVENVYSILGYFYDDLAKVLKRLVENSEYQRDYKYDCFSPYITHDSYQDQLRRAVSLAIANLEKAIGVNQSSEQNKYRRRVLAAIKSGEDYSWHWCAD
jgi:hypothetical protein